MLDKSKIDYISLEKMYSNLTWLYSTLENLEQEILDDHPLMPYNVEVGTYIHSAVLILKHASEMIEDEYQQFLLEKYEPEVAKQRVKSNFGLFLFE